MGRGLAGRPVACGVHPHRPATDRCDDCLGRFCADCLVRAGETLRCRVCTASLPDRAAGAAAARRWGPRLRAAVRERAVGLALTAGAMVVLGAGAGLAVVGGASGSGATDSGLARALQDEPAVVQRAIAARFCAGGGGTSGDVPGAGVAGGAPDATPTPEPGAPPAGRRAVLTAPTGALIADVAGVLADTRLRDDRVAVTPLAGDPGDPLTLVPYRGGPSGGGPDRGWRSPTGLLPQQVGFVLRGTVTVDRVAFRQAAGQPRESWAKEVGLWLSAAGPDRGYYLVGRWLLATTADAQEFVFTETPARYARVCVYANDGHREFVSLGAFVLGVTPPPALIETQSKPLLPREGRGR